jgi:hypothetical protein
MYHIHIEGKGRRRGPWIIFCGQIEFPYDRDAAAGAAIVRALGSTQAVLDQYRKRFDANRCLERINVSHLLPRTLLL